jgi:hypothetical protein
MNFYKNLEILFKKKLVIEEDITFQIVEQIIKQLRDEFIEKKEYYILERDKGKTPDYSDINNGYCAYFAEDLIAKLDAVGIKSEYNWQSVYKHIPHAFVKVKDLYFDSECERGVSDWKQLPIYKNS